MRTELCDLLDIEAPIFAFSHSPAVVAGVSRAGGFGVLGAAGFAPDELDRALRFVDRACGGKPYGVDLIIPARCVGQSVGKLESVRPAAEVFRTLVEGCDAAPVRCAQLAAPGRAAAVRAAATGSGGRNST